MYGTQGPATSAGGPFFGPPGMLPPFPADPAPPGRDEVAPADQNPDRKYYLLETDGEWTVRTRRLLDSGSIGRITWHQYPDGRFYARRVASG